MGTGQQGAERKEESDSHGRSQGRCRNMPNAPGPPILHGAFNRARNEAGAHQARRAPALSPSIHGLKK
ncbi:hypothetical protein A176_000439 [Myxococcus hansupus]|uniref:Uncharacterized protein n=1 Tax=Pseudomyxococcus hansupus TaxID=1297742 RepID=A0A0H4X6Q4_9BACT|nr:hypothetical protein A176_000439 [Myxococcus hansupus]